MSGGQFLVLLREAINSERFLSNRAVTKPDLNFQEKDLTTDRDTFEGEKQNLFNVLFFSMKKAMKLWNAVKIIVELKLPLPQQDILLKSSQENLNAKHVQKEIKGDNEINFLHYEYFKRLARGALTVTPSSLADFTCDCFTIFDSAETEF